MRTAIRVAAEHDLWEGEMRGIDVAGVPVLLVNIDGQVHAFRDRCAHLGVRLSEGKLQHGVVTCRAHEWRYDLRTGTGVNPAGVTLERFAVTVTNGCIYVNIGGACG